MQNLENNARQKLLSFQQERVQKTDMLVGQLKDILGAYQLEGTDTQRVDAIATTLVADVDERSEEHTSELQSPCNLECRLLLEKKKTRETAPATSRAALPCPTSWLRRRSCPSLSPAPTPHPGAPSSARRRPGAAATLLRRPGPL